MQLIPRDKIDIDKWNACVRKDAEASPYMYTFYLDSVCAQWSAVVFEDYESFMPVCWNKKWGIKYAYQPPFLQRMELVGDKHNKHLQREVHRCVNRNFFYVDFKTQFYADNSTTRNNHILSLNKPYEQLSKAYSSQTKRNLKKGDIDVKLIDDIEWVLKMYREHTVPKIENWKPDFSERQKNVLSALHSNNLLKMYGAYYQGEIIASNAVIDDPRKIILLMSSSNDKGRELGGFSYIVDTIIREHAGQEKILDFEGSQIPGIAKFNEGFGAQPEEYFHWKWVNGFWG